MTNKPKLDIYGDSDEDTHKRLVLERNLREAEATSNSACKAHEQLQETWGEESQRVLAVVFYSPPMSVSSDGEQFVEDWALIDLDRDNTHFEKMSSTWRYQ